MAKIVYGERIGKSGKIRVGCSAVIFDEQREKILLTRRDDNGLWCLPSGGMEPGEDVEETCKRETLEETGLEVSLTRLIGVYSTPHELIIYPDGNQIQLVALCFEAVVNGGELQLSRETTQFGYFSKREMAYLSLLPNHVRRIEDAYEQSPKPYIK